jgi:hypothetical protein
MRKLLILILVLGIASAANAAFSIVGPTEINKDDTVTIDIISDSAAGQVAYLSFKYVSEGGFDLSNPRSPFLPPPIPPIPTPDDSIEFELVFASPDLMPGIWFEVDLTCLKAGVDVLVELYDSALPPSLLDSLTIHQVSGPYASNPNPADGAVITGEIYVDNIWTKLIFVPGATAVKHTGYFSDNYDDVTNRIEDANLGAPPYAAVPGWEYTFFAGNPAVPPAVETLLRSTKYYWCVDETDAMGTTFPGDIWDFAVQGFKAFAPNPPDGAVVSGPDVLLSWLPGFGVTEHDVYLGTDFDDVNNAIYDPINPPPEYIGTVTEPNILVTGLSDNTTYYWRVDEISGRFPPPLGGGTYYLGDVWSFTVTEGKAQADFPADGAVIPGDIVMIIYGPSLFSFRERPRSSIRVISATITMM